MTRSPCCVTSFIAVSDAARAYPERLFRREFRVVPNGVDVRAFARAVGKERVEGRICFIGRADRRKGIGILVAAFAELRRRRPHMTLTIIGATRRQIIEQLHAGPSRQIDFAGIETTGWVTDDEKIDRLAQAHVVCAPSLAAESFGILLVEAMAAGVPVVASDLPGYRSVLQDGRAGRLVPPNDSLCLANALDDVLRDALQRTRMTEAGLIAARTLSWTHVTKQILAAYEDALEIGEKPYGNEASGGAWLGRSILRLLWRDPAGLSELPFASPSATAAARTAGRSSCGTWPRCSSPAGPRA